MASSYIEGLNRLIREFVAGLREQLAILAEEDPEVIAERVFAAITAAAAAALLLLPIGRRRDGIITALLAALARFWARRAVL